MIISKSEGSVIRSISGSSWHQIKTHELAGRIFEDEYDKGDRRYRWDRSSRSKRKI